MFPGNGLSGTSYLSFWLHVALQGYCLPAFDLLLVYESANNKLTNQILM